VQLQQLARLGSVLTHVIGDDGSEDNGDLESFHFRLADADPNIHNIALVINVATDGEDLTDVMSCGVRFRALDSKPEEGVTMHVTTERITGTYCKSLQGRSHVTEVCRERDSTGLVAACQW
jgi:hypothetical protein